MSKQMVVDGMLDSGVFASRAAAEAAYDAVLDSLTEALVQSGNAELRPFGAFRVHERKARTGRNPRTGKPLAIPAHRVVVFRPGSALRRAPELGEDWLGVRTYTLLLDSQVREIKDFLRRTQAQAKAGRLAREAAEGLHRLTDEASARLKEYAQAGRPAWTEIKSGLERAYGELKTAFLKAKDKF